MNGSQLRPSDIWTAANRIDSGVCGQVYLFSSSEEEAVAKLIPKARGCVSADRALKRILP